jgi:hypothetical protein
MAGSPALPSVKLGLVREDRSSGWLRVSGSALKKWAAPEQGPRSKRQWGALIALGPPSARCSLVSASRSEAAGGGPGTGAALWLDGCRPPRRVSPQAPGSPVPGADPGGKRAGVCRKPCLGSFSLSLSLSLSMGMLVLTMPDLCFSVVVPTEEVHALRL